MKVPYISTIGVTVLAIVSVGRIAFGVDAPTEAPSPHNERKNRYVSFVPSGAVTPVAYRVELTASLYFPGSLGAIGWVSEPYDPGCPNPEDPPELCAGEYVATLACGPVFRVWDESPVIHVGDALIVPVATYEIRAFSVAKQISTPLTVGTIRKPAGRFWGDIVGLLNSDTWLWDGPDGFVNITDLQATIIGMQATATAPPIIWTDLRNQTPDYIINIADIQAVKQGFKGWEYPYVDPGDYILPDPPDCIACDGSGICDLCAVADGSTLDCNGNWVPDSCDIDPSDPDGNGSVSDDCAGTGNGIPDECEPDCNDNGIADSCDISSGASDDCNANAVPDDCEPDCNNNGIADECDITDCSGDPWCGDCDSNGIPDECDPDCNGNEIADACDIAGNPALHADSDGDRLLDECETNTGVFVSLADAGTNPADPDTDGDGIDDGDEVFTTESGLELPAMGANPTRKSIFVEMDWFDDNSGGAHSHRPTDAAVQYVIEAFTRAPVSNPDGSYGIDLIVDYGQGGLFTGGNLIPGGATVVRFPSDFSVYKLFNFAVRRIGYFRYGIHAHSSGTLSTGVAEVPGDEFLVTLQNDLSDRNVSRTTMHELGHNLSLRHGGFENTNYKPNYNSVMNYRYQFQGIDVDCDALGDDVMDYSYGNRLQLDENDLDELVGVCGSGNSIDWDGDFVLSSGVDQNVNCQSGLTFPCGSNPESCDAFPCCDDADCNLLEDYNDWANLIYDITTASRAASEISVCNNKPPNSSPKHSREAE